MHLSYLALIFSCLRFVGNKVSNDLTLIPRAPLEFRDFLAPLVRREREDLVVSPVVLDPVDLLESVYVISSLTSCFKCLPRGTVPSRSTIGLGVTDMVGVWCLL